MKTYQRYQQLTKGLQILKEHQNKKCTGIVISNAKHSTINIWLYQDGWAVMKYNLVVYAYYNPNDNKIYTVKNYSPSVHEAFKKFADVTGGTYEPIAKFKAKVLTD